MVETAAIDLRVRHRPVQERGRVRFDRILSAARELLQSEGLANFTIEDVAETAGIPVGSIYQFFPNKFAIVAELDAQDTALLIDDLVANADRFTVADWHPAVSEIIDLVARHWVEDPSRRAVWLAMRSTATTRSLAREHARAIVAVLLPVIARLADHRSAQQQATVAEVIVETAQSLLHYSVVDGESNPAIVDELKRMLRAYLRAIARDS
jgi:AcrR family transcriptional regulator